MTKTFNNLREEQLLNEFRVVRAGAALLFASQVKQRGNALQQKIRDADTSFNRAKQLKELDAKINTMMEGLEHLGQALIQNRLMLGKMTAIAVVSTLLTERSNKALMKLVKDSRKRR